MSYQAPVKDLLFGMEALAELDDIVKLPGFEDAGLDTAAAVLQECARFNEGVIAPLNRIGDQQPSTFLAGQVTTPPGFKSAFRQFVEGGWQGLQHPVRVGGQGLPKVIGTACTEMLHSASLSFALCPMLTDSAIDALLVAGTKDQQNLLIPKLIDGTWTGTMNLTEPQAGSDLSLIKTRAERRDDGTYRLFGTKIFITYGEHDLAENIIHMVLARVPGAPEGVKGMSLFVVPKFLIRADGQLGARNDVHCVSIEHKLGIKASPTAVLAFGAHGGEGLDGPGAVGTLVGEENRGLEYMFIMMNSARFGVGIQGLSVAERAYQKAVQYAKDRVQSRPVDGSQPGAACIIHHPDVRRMLMTMRALTEATRAMALVAASKHDHAWHAQDDATRQASAAMYEFLVPLVKGFGTEMSQEVTSLGIQVHGGMGFIEETGAAQYFRDARILTIYEGTTAIQANDFVGRKTVRDGGEVARLVASMIERTEAALAGSGTPHAQAVRQGLARAREDFLQAVTFVVARYRSHPNAVFAGSVPYLMLAGHLIAGWQMARGLLAAQLREQEQGQDRAFFQAKIATARFYAEHILPRTSALTAAILSGGDSVMGVPVEAF